ncbi:ferric reductase domain-containing protein [Chondrocystis sp. NIES-4102]|nr:ferric reductase domain-containing protein [Chondrocystis sp. NIES-4102]
MLDLLLIFTLGFLGSFGHCVGMCGPLTVAFALSQADNANKVISGWQFQTLLNLGRIVSYALVGAALGGLGSAFVASGQLAGIGSYFRQLMAFLTGILLIWFGLSQIKPNWLPRLPLLHPLQGDIHNRLSLGMNKLATQQQWWTPALLGSIWGLIPCGFLYVAQLKAVETGSLLSGAITMFCFGLGTMPIMLGVGISATKVSADRRSQLFRLGGWVTLMIGFLTLLRTDAMVDYTGHTSLFLLMLALVARPLSRFWAAPWQYRRLIGVTAFILALVHTGHMLNHSFNWNLEAIAFMLPQHRLGVIAGVSAIFLMFPAAITSSDRSRQKLRQSWRKIHLLTVPALILAITHTVLLGSHYLGDLELGLDSKLRVLIIILLGIVVLLLRSPFIWAIFGRRQDYVPPKS